MGKLQKIIYIYIYIYICQICTQTKRGGSAGGGVSDAVRHVLTTAGTGGLLLVGSTEFCHYTQILNIWLLG